MMDMIGISHIIRIIIATAIIITTTTWCSDFESWHLNSGGRRLDNDATECGMEQA